MSLPIWQASDRRKIYDRRFNGTFRSSKSQRNKRSQQPAELVRSPLLWRRHRTTI